MGHKGIICCGGRRPPGGTPGGYPRQNPQKKIFFPQEVTHGTQVAIFLYDNKTTQFLNDMIFIM